MLTIPEKHKATIRALVKADPEVAQATCDIPHLDPHAYQRSARPTEDLPFCGCFIGVYAWMQECKNGGDANLFGWAPTDVSRRTSISEDRLEGFAFWCITPEKDQLAVRYARSLLE